ncbi:methylated-DNA--[protein]-cysteine S-methyltransferase [Pseudoclavibacter sp. 13-3]|uniref:methylated-DNA--[protein]-cysteine S-methyltransferase n=1 Tax=Pseudoclavibacter sp. 13-3 TaxID=2901228 RepID=UPI001E451A1D|nr:methylated-DNA--[protein]-cysteine S-methyltransferase [Pseudoclavibacter sp. 13-3]MCD7101051.1 methylated-DNA--[protein]-cysteine S-methyltransferase [Pseudoclavibacter sp. 13-3]
MNPMTETPAPTPDTASHSEHPRGAPRASTLHRNELTSSVVSTPIGPLLVATTERGVVRVAFAAESIDSVLTDLVDRLRPDRLIADEGIGNESVRHLAAAEAQLREYFTGRLQTFTVPIDDALSSGFYLEVRQALRQVPFGTTTTYTALAERLGRPKAVRAVGTGCSGNPVPVIVPCHRVTRADGSLGGYRGGAPAKAILQALEADALR